MLGPSLVDLSPPTEVRAVALVLHGGKERSHDAALPSQLAALRMRPFAKTLQRRGAAHGLAVSSLGYRYRGWNGDEASPVADARWALDALGDRHGDVPVVLVGHSMGGRAALRVADHGRVVGVVALAPWLTPNDPVAPLVGPRTMILHGNLDFVTSPRMSRRFAARARAAGADISYRVVHGDNHAMLLRAPTWHRLTARAVLDFVRPA
ncbi:MAG TPA: alpha/beta fold hydrolase [Mycobacteriales bacterium]|nr:alpha/beta fold hydrolase [Mycobacteriales bacterium]